MDINTATEQAYRNGYEAGKETGMPKWIPVSFQKPEENKEVKIYKDGHISFISVLVFGGNRGINIANRVYIAPVGIPYLDEHATNGWEWSRGNEDVTHWMPLPKQPTE